MPDEQKTSTERPEGSVAQPTDHNPNKKVAGSGYVKEFGGPAGPEPTRYGDWEKNGRCIDF